MGNSSAGGTACLESPVVDGVQKRLVEELTKIVGPLAEATDTALALVANGEITWIAACGKCPCSQSGKGFIQCLNGGNATERSTESMDVFFKGESIGQVVTCCDRPHQKIAASLHHIVDATTRQIEMRKDQETLQTDLRASGQSLEAVFDISSNLRGAENHQELMQHILTKIQMLQPGMCAVLWLEDEGQLVPKAMSAGVKVEPRNAKAGLLGKTWTNSQHTTVNGRENVARIGEREPELAGASCLMIIPIGTKKKMFGVLEAWHESSELAFDSRHMQIVETLAFLAAMVVENDRLQRTSVESDRVMRDIEIASRIQQTLLLGKPPLDMQMIRAAALTIPSWQIDGDFYDFYAQDKILDVIVGDVMGKGIPAALVGAATKHHFLRALNYLLSSNPAKQPEPKEVLTIVNEELVKQLVGIESFVTLVYARFDLRNQRLDFIDCGHTKTIHVSARAGKFSFLQGENMPIGFALGENYERVTVPFVPNDVFLFYSDGVTEAKNADGEYFGEQRLAELVLKYCRLEPKGIVDKVRDEVSAFTKAETYSDDLTCVAVKIQDVQATIASTQATLEINSDLTELPRVRAFVRDLCQQNFDLATVEEELCQVELAITEAVANIIIHAYQRKPDRKIRIKLDLFVNRLSIRLYHRGQTFDPKLVEPTNLDTPRENRMGLHIIRESMDQVKYYSAEHGENCVHMIKIFKLVPY